jgi:hypothetical protein
VRRNASKISPKRNVAHGDAMPKKQTVLTDEERAKRVRAAARKIGADDKEAFERAFKRIVPAKAQSPRKG